MSTTVRPNKNNPSDEEREFGRDHGLIHETIVTGRKVGAGQVFWSRLAHEEQLFGEIVNYVVGYPVFSCTTVDYTKSFTEMIKDGQYYSVGQMISNGVFPIIGSGIVGVDLGLLHLNRRVSNDEALREIEFRKLRPATFAELLAFTKEYHKNHEIRIAALGSTHNDPNDGLCVPFFEIFAGMRCLYGLTSKNGWHEVQRFLVAPKEK